MTKRSSRGDNRRIPRTNESPVAPARPIHFDIKSVLAAGPADPVQIRFRGDKPPVTVPFFVRNDDPWAAKTDISMPPEECVEMHAPSNVLVPPSSDEPSSAPPQDSFPAPKPKKSFPAQKKWMSAQAETRWDALPDARVADTTQAPRLNLDPMRGPAFIADTLGVPMAREISLETRIEWVAATVMQQRDAPAAKGLAPKRPIVEPAWVRSNPQQRDGMDRMARLQKALRARPRTLIALGAVMGILIALACVPRRAPPRSPADSQSAAANPPQSAAANPPQPVAANPAPAPVGAPLPPTTQLPDQSSKASPVYLSGRTLERAAVDAVAQGAFAQAAALYRRLATDHPGSDVYAVAERVATRKATTPGGR